VAWDSQANGAWTTKEGTIVEVVPANTEPKSRVGEAGSTRDHTSYVVEGTRNADKVGGKRTKFYWPRTVNLRRAAQAIAS
jgi:hypothetical protein